MARLIAVLVVVAAGASPLAAQQWDELGGSASEGGVSATLGMASYPSVVMDGQGRPVVAWVNSDGGRGDAAQVYLRRWNGLAWVELGGSATKGGVSGTLIGVGSIALAIDAQDHPVVAWTDTDPETWSSQVYLRRWDGLAWVELGGSATGLGVSGAYAGVTELSLAVDAGGNPVLAWGDYLVEFLGIRTRIYLRRWSGDTWEELGGSATDGGVSNSFHQNLASPVVRVKPDGNPVVAWTDMYEIAGSYEPAVYVRTWNGDAWVELGASATGPGVSGGTGYVGNARMTIDSQGRPAVLWSANTDGPANLYLRRWSGATWEELGGSASGSGISAATDASAWDSSIDAGPLGLAVAWTSSAWDRSRPNRVHLRRWDGSAWIELAASATDDGVSTALDNLTHAVVPSVGAARGGGLAVAWFQWSEAEPAVPQNVFLRAWDDPSMELKSVAQLGLDGTTTVPSGGWAGPGNGVVLRAKLTHLLGHDVRLEIEVKELGSDFTGAVSGQSAAAASGTTLSVPIEGLVPGRSYHWRARGYDVDDAFAGEWVSFGTNLESEADFVAGTPPSAPADDDDKDSRCSASAAPAAGWIGLLLMAGAGLRRRAAASP